MTRPAIRNVFGEVPHFVAVDPGLAAVGGSGWAFFSCGVLQDCGVLRNEKTWKTMAQRVNGQAALLDAVLADLFVGGAACRAPVVSEWMCQIYKVPAQDLIDLQTLSGKLGDVWVKPRDWKGTVPRDVEQSRTRVALTPEERDVMAAACAKTIKGMHKEIWSAVGIGLSVAGRAHRKCGFPESKVA